MIEKERRVGSDRHSSLYSRWIPFVPGNRDTKFVRRVRDPEASQGFFNYSRRNTGLAVWSAVRYLPVVLEALARRQGLQKCRTEGQYLPLTRPNRFVKINQIPDDVARFTVWLCRHAKISLVDNPWPINETTDRVSYIIRSLSTTPLSIRYGSNFQIWRKVSRRPIVLRPLIWDGGTLVL